MNSRTAHDRQFSGATALPARTAATARTLEPALLACDSICARPRAMPARTTVSARTLAPAWPVRANASANAAPVRIAISVDATRTCLLIQSATAAAFGVPLDEMRAVSRRVAKVAFARQSAMYLAHVALGLNFSAVGVLFPRDRTTAAYACKTVEDRRDDPAIDRLLQRLEDVCGRLAGSFVIHPQVRP